MLQSYKQKVEPESKGEQFRHIKLSVRFGRILNQTVQLNPKETLVELKQYLSQTTLLALHENYHFTCKGKQVPQYNEIQSIVEGEAVIEVALRPFDERTIRYHVRKVQQVVANPQLWAVLNYKEKQQRALREEDEELVHKVELEELQRPDFLSKLFNRPRSLQYREPLVFLNFSAYNPPPNANRLAGDLLYLHMKSLEGEEHHITGSVRGFFLNCSTLHHFEATMNPIHQQCYSSLLDLLFALSPQFKQVFAENAEKVVLTEVQRLVLTSSYKNSKVWLKEKSNQPHKWNANISTEDEFSSEPNCLKDWNEMLQSQSTLPTNTLLDRLNKSKMLIKVYNEFVGTALQGAKALVEGRLSPLNPLDDKLQHIYINNSIFYSMAHETPFDYSQEKGIDATPSVTAINSDLRNLGVLMGLDIKDLHVLHMVLIQYRGHRVIAQCIIPGILSADQLQCSQYGSIDDGKTIATNEEFEALMVQVCSKLGLDPCVQFLDDKGEKKRISGSYEIKGILGSDKRRYLLDLMRLSPRDYNFIGEKYHCCVLRHELIGMFRSSKEGKAYQNVTINVNLETGAKFIRNAQTPKQEQLLAALAAYLKRECIPQLIKALATTHRRFLSDCKGVSKVFHKFGVNCRYLGEVLRTPLIEQHLHIRMILERVVLVKSVKHLLRIAMRETSPLHMSRTVARMLNCIFGRKKHRQILQQQDLEELEERRPAEQMRRKKKKKASKHSSHQQEDEPFRCVLEDIIVKPSIYNNIRPSQVWEIVRKLAESRYQHALPASPDECVELSFGKVATLRDVCVSTGIVLERRNYDIFQHNQQGEVEALPFLAQNILDIQPIPKHIALPNKETASLIERADQHLAKFQIEEAIELYNNAVQYMVGLYGGMSDEIAAVHHKIASVYYKLGDFDTAIMCERSSLELLEALYGQDDVLTVESYSNLAIFYFSKLEKDRAIYYLFKGIYISSFAFGESYPETVVSRLHLAAVFQECAQYQLAILTLMDTIDCVCRVYGRNNVNTAVCYQALASLHYEINDLRQTIEFQELAVGIFRAVLKQNDGRLTEANNNLNKYKQLLSNKRIREDCSFKKSSREEAILSKPFLNGQLQNGSFQRNVILNKLQLAKWNARRGLRR